MKRKISVFLLLFSFTLCYSQQEPISGCSPQGCKLMYWNWAQSNMGKAQPEKGYFCNYVSIGRMEDDYYILFTVYSKSKLQIENPIDQQLILQDSKGQYYSLKPFSAEPVHYEGSEHPVLIGRNGFRNIRYYMTTFVYEIPAVDDFLSHTYVKYEFFRGLSKVDFASDDKFCKKFNKRLKSAKKAAERQWNRNLHHAPLDMTSSEPPRPSW